MRASRLPIAIVPRRLAVTWQNKPVWPAAILLLIAVAGPADAAGKDRAAGVTSRGSSTREDGAAPTRKRLREGSRIVDQIGSFKLSLDRATFTATADGQHQLEGLPNLNLERIVRTLRDHPDQLVWRVSGTVTEYQGTNYILITRAVLKSKQSRRAATPVERTGLPPRTP